MSVIERLYKVTLQGEQAKAELDKLGKATAKLDKAFNKNKAAIKQLRKAHTTEINKMQAQWKKLNTTLIGVGAGLTLNFAKDVLVQFEDIRHALGVVTGSAEQGAFAFEALSDIAQRTPFNVNQLSEAFLKLRAAGIAPTTKQMTLFADIASSTTDKIGALKAMADLYARTTSGGLGLEDLNRLVDRGIPAFDIIEKKLGVTRLEIAKLGKTAEGTDQIIGALEEGLTKLYSGATEDALGNLSTIINNLGAEMSLFIFEVSEATGILDALKWILVTLTDLIRGLKENIVSFTKDLKNLEVAAVSFSLVIGGTAVVALGKFAFSLRTAVLPAIWKVIAVVSNNPLGLFIKGLFLAGGALIAFWDDIKGIFESDVSAKARKTLEDQTFQTNELKEAAEKAEKAFNKMFAALNKELKTPLEKEQDVIDKLVLDYNLLIKNMNASGKEYTDAQMAEITNLGVLIQEKVIDQFEKVRTIQRNLEFGNIDKLLSEFANADLTPVDKLKKEISELETIIVGMQNDKKGLINPGQITQAQLLLASLNKELGIAEQKTKDIQFKKDWRPFKNTIEDLKKLNETPMSKLEDELTELEALLAKVTEKPEEGLKLGIDITDVEAGIKKVNEEKDKLNKSLVFKAHFEGFEDTLKLIEGVNLDGLTDAERELGDLYGLLVQLDNADPTIDVSLETAQTLQKIKDLEEEIEKLKGKTKDWSTEFKIAVGGIMKDSVSELADGLVEFAMTGEQSFGQMIKSMLAGIAKLALQMTLLEGLEQSGFMKFFSRAAGAAVGGGTNPAPPTTRSLMPSTRALTPPTTTTPTIPSSLRTFSVTPKARKEEVTPLNVQVNNYGNDEVKVDRTGNDIKIVIAEVAKDILNGGGAVSNSLQQSYGLSRARTAY